MDVNVKKDSFFKKSNFENKTKSFKPNDKGGSQFTPSNAVKRLKRNDLIAQREKEKMKHKFNKEMRKENKANFRLQKESSNKKSEARTSKAFKLSNKSSFERAEKEEDKSDANETDKPKQKPLSSYKKAQIEYENNMKEKQKEIEEAKKKKEEKLSALKKYKKNKKEKFRSLCKRTGSGQILMGRQVDSLLEKIERQTKK